MKKIICPFVCVFAMIFSGTVFAAQCVSCGDGYVMVDHPKIEGINAKECKKVWCYDLEKDVVMGEGNIPNSGYESTTSPYRLCDNDNNCVVCWGDRKWCAGQPRGEWNPQYGSYVPVGQDFNANVSSILVGNCFSWEQKGYAPSSKKRAAGSRIRSSGVRRTGSAGRSTTVTSKTSN